MTASGRALLIVVVVTAGLAGFVAMRFVAEAPPEGPGATPMQAASAPAFALPASEPRRAAPTAPVADAPAATPPAATPPAIPQQAASARVAVAAPAAPTAGAAAATPPAQSQPAPAPLVPPRFDVVRIGARGAAVVAGRAAAGAEVLLMEDGREIARARADGRGEWVILPPEPLRPGTRRFVLLARLGGEEVIGPDTVVVVVPEPPPAIAEVTRGTPPASLAEVAQPREAAAPAAPDARQASAPGPQAEPPARRPAIALAGDAAATPAPAQARDAAQGERAEAATPREDAASRRAEAPAQPLIVLLPGSQPEARVLQRAAAQPGLAIGQVDYDDAGSIRFAGTAAPGAMLRLYVNDRHAGDAQADDQGRWTLAPGEAVEIGRHRLRVDQIAAAGVVAARIEVPFQRDRLPETATADGRIVVQPGHSLWRLARAVYGQGVRYTVIYDANREQIRNPNLIFPGQVFTMPGMSPEGAPAAPAESSRSR